MIGMRDSLPWLLGVIVTLGLVGCAQKSPGAAGDVTLASSPGATTSTTVGGPPVRLQSVRVGSAQPTSGGDAATTASGATTNIVFASASESDLPSGGDVVASAAASSAGTSSSGESVFSSLLSFFKSGSSDQISSSDSSSDSSPDTTAPIAIAANSTVEAAVADRSARGAVPPAPSSAGPASGAPRLGLAPGSAGPTPIGQAPAPSRVQSASSVPLVANTIPWRVVDSTFVKPNCTGAECPKIKVRRLLFSGRDRFNKFLEETLVSLAELDTKQSAPFKTLAAFQKYFFTVAKPRWEVVLEAGVRRDTPELVIVQLDSYVFAGGAHGASTTQYINWLPKVDRLLTLESMLLPNTAKQFEQALRRQHAAWLKTNSLAQENPAAYNKTWPFTMSDNVALLAEGLAVTYDPYVLAPYSFGRPTLIIPYGELKGILRPEILPG